VDPTISQQLTMHSVPSAEQGDMLQWQAQARWPEVQLSKGGHGT
jgi:hypothetical protein